LIPGIWELLDYVANQINNLGLVFIWSYQNSPRMDKPYVVIDYVNNDLPDFEVESSYIDNDGFRSIGAWRKASVSLQFYCGTNSDRIASQIALMLSGNSAVDKQVELDVSIGTRLMFQRVPALLNNSQYEDRAIYDFDFYYTDHYKDNVGIIDTVRIIGGYSGDILNPPATEPPDNASDILQWPIHCDETVSVPGVEHFEDGDK